MIETAQKLHEAEPDAQLLMVDDDSRLGDYVANAKAASGKGEDANADLPKEWADKHIDANVQKPINGRSVLCEGNRFTEIAVLD